MSSIKTVCHPLLCSFLVAFVLCLASLSSVANEGISRSEAIEIVEKKVGGKVLDVKKEEGGYRIKLLSEGGTVRQIFVSAQSGQIIKPKQK